MPENPTHTALAQCITQLGTAEFSAALLAFLRTCASFDSVVIMAYPANGDLQVVHNNLHPGDQSGFNGAYRDGLWLLSPLYLSAKAGVRGCYHLDEMTPNNFSQSEFYALYYRSNGIVDHVVFLLESGDGTPLAISLERTAALPAFSQEERHTLQSMSAVVAALVKQNWPVEVTSGDVAHTYLHAHKQRVLDQFGRSLLTPREREVVQLLLRGYSSKRAATTLNISTQTEQVHRKNIYNKLHLSSHNELFSLFFDALLQPCPADADPLALQLQQRKD